MLVHLAWLSVAKPVQEDPRTDRLREWLDKIETADPPHLQQSVLKFVKPTDKYLALASVLLKSQAYHVVMPSTRSSEQSWNSSRCPNCRHCVELPRTPHGKPYLPSTGGNHYPLNISHQHPFVGMALSVDPNPRYHLGMDIVVVGQTGLEGINRRLYPTTTDYINCFCDNFAPSEWKMIGDSCSESAEAGLGEFSMHWAIKEAYTKALGFGLGFDFSSFSADLGLDSIWKWFQESSSSDSEVLQRVATIAYTRQPRSSTNNSGGARVPPKERWIFGFVPLFDEDPRIVSGVACTAVGPIPDTIEVPDISMRLERVEWVDLLSWHHCNRHRCAQAKDSISLLS